MITHADQEGRPCNYGSLAIRILQQLFRDYPHPLAVRLWNGEVFQAGSGVPLFALVLQRPGVLRDLLLHHDAVRLAEAYCNGEVDVEGDFDAAVRLRYYLEALYLSPLQKAMLAWRALGLSEGQRPRSSSGRAAANKPRPNGSDTIAFHYDLSNAFYRLWLDERMIYSCAYFETPEQDLEQAQRNKLEHICRKLRLRPGETLLDIGCGWGALACWAARNHGVRVHGITLSRNQYDHACEEVRRQGLQDKVGIEFRDYRELPDVRYDKVVSVGMFEHVGLKNLPGYFATVKRVLKPDGLFLNHGITSDEPGWKHGTARDFINRHVFPDGELDSMSNIQAVMESAGFEIFDVEGLRPHYALTLRHWVRRLEDHHQEAVRLVGERSYRVWRLYMTASAQQFESGATGICQILVGRKGNRPPPVPLTRRDLYA